MAAGNIIYGLNTVLTALEHDREGVSEIWVDNSRRDARIRRVIQLAGCRVHRVSKAELDELVPQMRHQGVVARSSVTTLHDEASLKQMLEQTDIPPFLLILDGVTDPHNLGACLRSADAAGVQAVIVPKDRAVGITPVVSKVASGAAEIIPFIQVTNLARTLRMLQQAGVWLVGLAGEGEKTLFETDLRGPLGLVLGAEGKGLRRLTREHCDILAKIPMQGQVESLNVSVATGIALFEALRQRNLAP